MWQSKVIRQFFCPYLRIFWFLCPCVRSYNMVITNWENWGHCNFIVNRFFFLVPPWSWLPQSRAPPALPPRVARPRYRAPRGPPPSLRPPHPPCRCPGRMFARRASSASWDSSPPSTARCWRRRGMRGRSAPPPAPIRMITFMEISIYRRYVLIYSSNFLWRFEMRFVVPFLRVKKYLVNYVFGSIVCVKIFRESVVVFEMLQSLKKNVQISQVLQYKILF